MPRLSNKAIEGSYTISGAPGPYLKVDSGFLFDARLREFPEILGHRANALFGVSHFSASWNGCWDEEIEKLKSAYLGLRERTKDAFAGQIRLKPISDETGNELKPAAMLYQYVCLSMLEQLEEKHKKTASAFVKEWNSIVKDFGELFRDKYCSGPDLEFGFVIRSEALAERLRPCLLQAGIQTKTIRQRNWMSDRWELNESCQDLSPNSIFFFQLTLDFAEFEMGLFWQRLRLAFSQFQKTEPVFDSPEIALREKSAQMADFHLALVKAKATGEIPRDYAAETYLQGQLDSRFEGVEVEIVTQLSYKKFRNQILELQQKVYEPARQSPPEEFDMLFESENPLAIVVIKDEDVVAMVFAGQLSLFTQERGVKSDPYLKDPTVYYSMDLTVVPEFRGGVGRLMKQALCLLAIKHGVTAIHGRNRDRLAAGMWAINLSLGAYELQHLVNDYPDEGPYRDCIYYRCPLKWPELNVRKLKPIDLIRKVDGVTLNEKTLD